MRPDGELQGRIEPPNEYDANTPDFDELSQDAERDERGWEEVDHGD